MTLYMKVRPLVNRMNNSNRPWPNKIQLRIDKLIRTCLDLPSNIEFEPLNNLHISVLNDIVHEALEINQLVKDSGLTFSKK